MDILESSLKTAIKESVEILSVGAATDLGRRPDRTLANLETNSNRLIEEKWTKPNKNHANNRGK